MEWTEVSVDPTTSERVLVCELLQPPEDSVYDFYHRINDLYSDCERHWSRGKVLLVRREKFSPDRVKTKKGKLR